MIKEYKYINVTQECYCFENKEICIWGRSVSALALYVGLCSRGVKVIGFTDSYASENEMFAGLPVFTFHQLQRMNNLVIYISTVNVQFLRQILDKVEVLSNADILCRRNVRGGVCYDVLRLRELMGKDFKEIEETRSALCDEKSIKTFDNLLKYRVSNDIRLIDEIYEQGHSQYFPIDEILPMEKGEIFIDVGGYDGKTSYEFAKWVKDDYSLIYIMEPNKLMVKVIEEYIKIYNLKNVVLINKGAYSSEKNMSFHGDYGSSRIQLDGEEVIQTITIDKMLAGRKVTYIKMDIEGAEMEALLGADQAIRTYRPKLAISIYHREDDLWKIPYHIKERYPWYKLYMRHYTSRTTETVLYAVADR